MKSEIASLRTDYFEHRITSLLGCIVLAVFLHGLAGCNWPTIPPMEVTEYTEGPYEVLVSDSGGIAISICVISPELFGPGSYRLGSEYGTNGIPAFLYANGPAFREYIGKRLPLEVNAEEPHHIEVKIDDLRQGVWILISAKEARQKNLWFSVETDEIKKKAGVMKYTGLEDMPYHQEICFPYKLGTQMVELSLSTENMRRGGVWW